MGAVGSQPPRSRKDWQSGDFAALIEGLLKGTHRPPGHMDSIARALLALEARRRNEIRVQDGDYRDEHVAGLCKSLDGIASAISALADAVSRRTL